MHAASPHVLRTALDTLLGRGSRLSTRLGGALPVPPATDRDVWDPERGAAADAVADSLRTARALAGEPWPQPLASAAADFHRTGDRVGWEKPAFAFNDRLAATVVTAAVHPEPQWLDRVADGVTLLCERTSWCWPAHDDALARRGWRTADPDSPFLDLGAGEVAGLLAWTDQLLGAQLDRTWPQLRVRIREEVQRRVLLPFVERRDWHWLGAPGEVHNWNPWIHQNVITAAIALTDPDDDLGRQVIDLAVDGLDTYVSDLGGDGSIDEGGDYWWNGACRALEALELLAAATGVDLRPQVPAIRRTVAFPRLLELGHGWWLSISDAAAKNLQDRPWEALQRAALAVGDPDSAAHAAAMARQRPARVDSGLGRFLQAAVTPVGEPAAPAPEPPAHTWFDVIELSIARQRPGFAGLTVSAKGGHNAENHNHNDLGSFTVASDGVPVLVDPGRPTYTAQTFGPRRFELWPMRSDWHNTPQVRGRLQGAGKQFRAPADFRVDGTEAITELDLSRAYAVPELQRWTRRIRSTPEHRSGPRVTVEDDWQFSATDDPAAAEPVTALYLIIAGSIELLPGGALIRPIEPAPTIELQWTAVDPPTVDRQLLDDPWLSEVWGDRLHRLSLDLGGLDSHRLTIRQTDPKEPV